MMTSHLGLMILFAALVSGVFAGLHRDDWPSGKRFAARLFSALVGGAFIFGWVLYFAFGQPLVVEVGRRTEPGDAPV